MGVDVFPDSKAEEKHNAEDKQCEDFGRFPALFWTFPLRLSDNIGSQDSGLTSKLLIRWPFQ